MRKRGEVCDRRGFVLNRAMFDLDPAFLATSEALGDLALCHVRLQADARFPWIVLIPRAEAARELEDLAPAERRLLMDEVLAAGHAVRAIGQALGREVAKLNVGQLGNITPQLHVHVVGRRLDDPAWPGPVWGSGEAPAYADDDLAEALAAAKLALGL
ncbi:MAG TPA: HIT domain-containing protein [Phenylobacterium sp.]|jgi:diadenosine tetraphosphate (Ap4A) HIT family hydrolase|nr:HIT domain-containing protein [Phenylobacterium sp.]